MNMTLINVVLGIGMLLLGACSTHMKSQVHQVYQDHPESADVLFHSGQQALAVKDHKLAAKQFQRVVRQYPDSQWSEVAHRRLIYAFYQSGDYPEASTAAEQAIRLFPRGEHTDYLYYLLALSHCQQLPGRQAYLKYLPLDPALRDLNEAKVAYQHFNTLVTLFPKSRYKNDALQHMIDLRNLFASYEWQVASFYAKRGVSVAASNRAKYLLEHYPQAPQAKQALELLNRLRQKDEGSK